MKSFSAALFFLVLFLAPLGAQDSPTRAGMVFQTDLGRLWLKWTPPSRDKEGGWTGFWKGPEETVRRPPVLGEAAPEPQAFKGHLRIYPEGEGYAGDWTEEREGVVLREGSVLLRFDGQAFAADLFDPSGKWLRSWTGKAVGGFTPADWILFQQETRPQTIP